MLWNSNIRGFEEVCNIERYYHQLIILKLYSGVHPLVHISSNVITMKSALPYWGKTWEKPGCITFRFSYWLELWMKITINVFHLSSTLELCFCEKNVIPIINFTTNLLRGHIAWNNSNFFSKMIISKQELNMQLVLYEIETNVLYRLAGLSNAIYRSRRL